MDGSGNPVIMLRDLRKSFGQVLALDGLSLAVPAGSITGLLGPNGSGKTTTVSILSTALRPDGGQALVCGLDVAARPAAVRRLIGFAGQFAAVDPNLTGRENLRLIGRLSRISDPEAAQAAGVPIMFLLVFASGAFVPIATMPGWLQAVAAHQPLTALVTAVRALVLGGPTAGHVLASVTWSCGLLAGFALLAISQYQRITR